MKKTTTLKQAGTEFLSCTLIWSLLQNTKAVSSPMNTLSRWKVSFGGVCSDFETELVEFNGEADPCSSSCEFSIQGISVEAGE